MRPIIFVNSITTTMSNEKKIKIKVVDLQRLNNFVVKIFLNLKSSFQRKVRLNFSNLKFKFRKRHRMEKVPKRKL